MALDHWVVIPDEDLRLIEDGPDDPTDFESLHAWIEDVQEIIADGLETA
jgi:hypothetical protein